VDVDLTPFGAATLGVSRRHIVIERVREVLHVTDLGSNNGTHLNRERLVPHTPYTLRNRAVLELGKLILRVQYM
jgi:pSer/pThr/pTyr-binding forkhead associated (FHA) protein